MQITLISFDNWGFNKHIAGALEKKGYVVNHIDFHQFVYKYPNFQTKIYNFILKIFFKKNLKNIYYGKEIIKKLEQIGKKQDVILTIKGDFIAPEYLLKIKKYTQKSIGYFNDNTVRCPKIIKAIPCFDAVFSFEKEDCKKYDLNFLTNWIYVETPLDNSTPFEYKIFNISTKDKRLPILIKISKVLKDIRINYKFLVLDKRNPGTKDGIEFFANKISLQDVSALTAKSKTLLDINRKGQNGLTFRVFESFGLKKKLITTNTDIVNYDFYNPNNILLIDENNPVIPTSFFESNYADIPESIYEKYTIDGWLKAILK